MSRNAKIITVLLLVLVLGGIGAYVLYMKKQSSPTEVVEVENDVPEQKGEILFEELPDYKVIKTSAEAGDNFEFFYKDKSLGQVELGKNWYVDIFLSFDNGDEFFGFTHTDAEAQGGYYGGPSILYLVNGPVGAFENWSNFPSTKFFVMDISEEEDLMVYANPTVSKSIFLKDLKNDQVREFPIGQDFTDFGDAILSEDNTQIAFAGVKTAKNADSQIVDFVESSINIIEVSTGTQSVYQINNEPGYYGLFGWDDNKVEYEYQSDEAE